MCQDLLKTAITNAEMQSEAWWQDFTDACKTSCAPASGNTIDCMTKLSIVVLDSTNEYSASGRSYHNIGHE